MNKKRALSDITFERRDKRMNLIGRCGSFSGSWCSFGRFFAAAVAQSVASVSAVSAVSSEAVRAVVSAVAQSVSAVSAISAVEGPSEAKVTASLQLNGVVTLLSKAGRDQRHHQQSLRDKWKQMRTKFKVLGLKESLTTARRAISFVFGEVASWLNSKRRVCADLHRFAAFYTKIEQKKSLKSKP